MRILVACEESQVITQELRALGHEAYSCDLEPCSGGYPEWHILGDAIKEAYSGKYDMMIAHPPCTYLATSGNRWMKPEYRDRFPNRQQQRQDAIEFFLKLYNAPIQKVAIENPVGIMSTIFRKPDQYVHPYFFGDKHSKKTGFWLKGLPKLKPTETVVPEMHTCKNGKKDPLWHFKSLGMTPKERAGVRSKTFPGLAKAIANQWAGNIT